MDTCSVAGLVLTTVNSGVALALVDCVFFCFPFQGLNSVVCMTSAATSVDDEALQNCRWRQLCVTVCEALV